MLVKLIKGVVNPFFSYNSLDRLAINKFVDVFYPIGLSLVLAVAITEIAEHCSGLGELSVQHLTSPIIVVLLIAYCIMDWDDCHLAVPLDAEKTSYDKMLWLFSIFIEALTMVVFIRGYHGTALIIWLVYSILALLMRDRILKVVYKDNGNNANGSNSNVDSNEFKLTKWDKYKEVYEVKRNFVVGLFALISIVVLFHEQLSNILNAQPPVDVLERAIHIVFVMVCLGSLWIKNYRKIQVLELALIYFYDNSKEGENGC